MLSLQFSRSWFRFRAFNELFQLRSDNCSPASFEILPRIRGSFRKCFNSRMRELQSRLITLGEYFKRDERISRLAFVSPGVSDFLLRNHFGDFAKVVISVPFVLNHEIKFEADLRLEFLQGEIPFPHLINIG